MVLTDLFSLEMITYPPHYRVLISYVSHCITECVQGIVTNQLKVNENEKIIQNKQEMFLIVLFE